MTNDITNTGEFQRVVPNPATEQLHRIASEAERLAREVDEVGDLLTRHGVVVPRSKPLAHAVSGVLDELARARRLLAHAVHVYGEEGTIAFPEESVALSAGRPLRVYENRDRGLVVMSRTDITEGDQVPMRCHHCHEMTSSLLPVCLQCGRAIYPAEREDAAPVKRPSPRPRAEKGITADNIDDIIDARRGPT